MRIYPREVRQGWEQNFGERGDQARPMDGASQMGDIAISLRVMSFTAGQGCTQQSDPLIDSFRSFKDESCTSLITVVEDAITHAHQVPSLSAKLV